MPIESLQSIDIGLHGVASAYFQNGVLLGAWYDLNRGRHRGPEAWATIASGVLVPSPPKVLTLETMQVYDTRSASGVNPDDLLQLQGVAGALAFRFQSLGAQVAGVLPAQWKQQVPKKVMNERVRGWCQYLGWLDGRIMLPGKERANDVWDAVGIGIVYQGLAGKLIRG